MTRQKSNLYHKEALESAFLTEELDQIQAQYKINITAKPPGDTEASTEY